MITRMLLSFALLISPLTGSTLLAAEVTALMVDAGFMVVDKPLTALDFTLQDSQGNTHRLHEQHGKVVLLNFWATWCPPCIHEMPLMETLLQSYAQQPFALWAINMQESAQDVSQFMQKKAFHFPALVDTKGEVAAQYMVQGLPTTYLIDCQGKMRGYIVGTLQWTSKATTTLLDTMLRDTACTPRTAAVAPLVPPSSRESPRNQTARDQTDATGAPATYDTPAKIEQGTRHLIVFGQGQPLVTEGREGSIRAQKTDGKDESQGRRKHQTVPHSHDQKTQEETAADVNQ
jgi:peroxiredoxin